MYALKKSEGAVVTPINKAIKTGQDRALVANSIPFSPELASRVGVCGALILQQIHYWTTMNLHVREGHSWVYKTYEDLVADIRMYDVSTVKRALAKLKNAKVIVVGKRMNKAGYDKTNWYRVDAIALDTLLETPALIGSKCTNPLGQNDPMDKVKKNRPIPETTTKTTDKDYTQTAGAFAGKPDIEFEGTNNVLELEIKKPESAIEKPIPEDISVNVNDVLAKFKSDKQGPLKTDSKGLNALSLLWKKRVALDGEYAKPLTGKEIGQLGHVHKALGGDALAVLDHALSDWQSFALQAAVQSGCVPAMNPTTGFFCTHYAVAVNSLHKKNAPVVIEPKPAQSVAAKCANTPTNVCDNTYYEPKATTSDVQATLAALASIVAANGNT